MADQAERITTPERMPGEGADRALRPTGFDEFVGQPQAKANLRVFVDAARGRGEESQNEHEGGAKVRGEPHIGSFSGTGAERSP